MIFQPVGVRSRSLFRSVASFARSRVAHERFLPNLFQSFVVPMRERTVRLQKALCQLGLTVGGQAGAEVGSKQGMSGSRDTILRLIRTVEPPATVPPKKVGVDDWAWKRGHRYGTLLCDLERAQVIDLLPDRSEESVTAWFAAHPSIELISRDGSSTYAAAALKGAPQAIQILDKWHLVKNLAKALQVLLTSHLTAHRKKKTQEAGLQKEFASLPESERRLSPQQARIQGVHREERLARYEQVIALAKQGMSQDLIARLVGVGHSTVSRWLQAGTFPERKPREQASQLDPYRSYVQKRQSQGNGNLMSIYRELQAAFLSGIICECLCSICQLFPKESPKEASGKFAAGTDVSLRTTSDMVVFAPSRGVNHTGARNGGKAQATASRDRSGLSARPTVSPDGAYAYRRASRCMA
jgi:predicted transcriptional regulator